MAAILDFRSERFSYFDLQVTTKLPTKFRVNFCLLVQEMKRKIDFQDGRHGGLLGLPIETILAIFDKRHPDLPIKFRVHWPRGVGGVSRLLKQLLTPQDVRRTTDIDRSQ